MQLDRRTFVRCIAATSVALSRDLPAAGREAAPSPSPLGLIARETWDGPGSRPLPLAASWSTGTGKDTFNSAFQLQRIQAGDPLLPWFSLPVIGQASAAAADAETWQQIVQMRLPVTFLVTEFERLMPGRNTSIRPLSPFSDPAEWAEAGRRWGRHPQLRAFQALYPDPPAVLIVANNEYPLERPAALTNLADQATRRDIGDRWLLRYRSLLQALRDELSPAWRAAIRLVGYDAFGGGFIGRWPRWGDYSLNVPDRFEPWPLAWDGASVSYYARDWDDSSDCRVFSPQIEAMNWVPMQRQLAQPGRDFWLELSVWDGHAPGSRRDRRAWYQRTGQQYDAERYGGMVRFGLWLLRPRLLRDYRPPDTTRQSEGEYFNAVVAAVREVHDRADLQEFWRDGRLVANNSENHPYDSALTEDVRAWERWFLLTSAQNPPRPWVLTTDLQVFAISLELGSAPQRRWLVYAFAPRVVALSTELQLPGYGAITVAAGRAGAFSLVSESDRRIRRLAADPS